MKAHIYKMTCLTNMHVGNGDVNYSIIDNEIERDQVLDMPIIPSSGVKGSLHAYAVDSKYEKTDYVFGSEEDKPGQYKFLTANLLARPVRVSDGDGAYVLATSPDILKELKSLCNDLDIRLDIKIPKEAGITNANDVNRIEEFEVKKTDQELKTVFGDEKWALLKHSDLKSISFPVVARNRLGENKNLWYEELVPHQSIFYMIIITPDNENEIDSLILGKVIQFGADASIGYGLVKVENF